MFKEAEWDGWREGEKVGGLEAMPQHPTNRCKRSSKVFGGAEDQPNVTLFEQI